MPRLNVAYSAQCFLEVNNGDSGNIIIRQVVPVAYYSIAEIILCNVKLTLRGQKFTTITSGGNSIGRGLFRVHLPVAFFCKHHVGDIN